MKSRIPENAKKVFKGVNFDIYQWSQEVYDGTIKTFEMIERKPCVSVIAVTEDGKLIKLTQEQPHKPLYICLPGGRIDQGETPEAAAVRELKEETGYVCNELKLFREYNGRGKAQFPDYLFLARNCKKVAGQNLDGGEKIEVQLIEWLEFVNLCRDVKTNFPTDFKFEMYEALLDPDKEKELKNEILN